MNTCATCQWMQPYATGKPEEGGECMVDPPIVGVVRNSVMTLRPSVLATDRCSAWDDGVAKDVGAELRWLLSDSQQLLRMAEGKYQTASRVGPTLSGKSPYEYYDSSGDPISDSFGNPKT